MNEIKMFEVLKERNFWIIPDVCLAGHDPKVCSAVECHAMSGPLFNTLLASNSAFESVNFQVK